MKIKECKSWARELLLGKYSTVVISQILFNIILFGLALAAVFSLCLAAGGPIISILAWNMAGTANNFRFHTSMAQIVAGSLMFTAFLFLLIILTLFKEYGFIRQMHNICRNDRAEIGDIFSAFKKGSGVWTYIGVWFIMTLIGTACGLLAGLLESVFIRNYISVTVYTALTALLIVADYLIMVKFYLADIVAITDPGRGVLGSMKEGARLMKGRLPRGFWLAYISFILWTLLVMICPLAGLFVTPYMTVTKMIFYFDAKDELWKIEGGRQRKPRGGVNGDSPYASANDNGSGSAPNAGGGYGSYTASGIVSGVGTTAPEAYAAANGKKAGNEETLSFEDAARAAGINTLAGSQANVNGGLEQSSYTETEKSINNPSAEADATQQAEDLSDIGTDTECGSIPQGNDGPKGEDTNITTDTECGSIPQGNDGPKGEDTNITTDTECGSIPQADTYNTGTQSSECDSETEQHFE